MNEYKYHWGMIIRIFPSNKQIGIIKRNAGAYRFVYNRLVAIDKELYLLNKTNCYIDILEDRKQYLQFLKKGMTNLENSAPFLYDKNIDSCVVANAKLHYKEAWNNMKINHTGVPIFHKKTNSYFYKTSTVYNKSSIKDNNSLFTGANVNFIDNNHIKLPILGVVKFKGSKKILERLFNEFSNSRIGSIKIMINECNDAYVSMNFANDHSFYEIYPKTNKSIASDLNLENFLYDSNGKEIENPHYLVKSQEKLIKLQKSLSRKQNKAKKENRDIKESKNYERNRIKLAILHKHITNQRKDFHYRVSKEQVKTHDYVFYEDLKVKNLLNNHKLAKAISDVGWSLYLTRCEWTAIKHGRVFKKVSPHFTTQTCSCCGYVLNKEQRLGLGDREWVCPTCNTYHIRDYNAAKNILNKGLSLI